MDWFSKALEGLLQLWERGETLLWALAIICAVAFAMFFGGTWLGVGAAASALASYGLWLVLGALVFGILAAVKTIEGRSRPSVHLIANNSRSLWGQSKQPNGRIITHLALHMQATNLTKKYIRLSAARLSRPWTRARVLQSQLATRNNDLIGTYSQENPIGPGATTDALCTFVLDGPVGRKGRPITAVIKVSDQFGRWHRLKFRPVDPSTGK